MNDTIYDFKACPPLVAPPGVTSARATLAGDARWRPGMAGEFLVGVIVNPRSRRHIVSDPAVGEADGVILAAPRTRADLRLTLAGFAERGIDLLVIDGGDGTIRDVLTCAETLWTGGWPRIAVVPSGKTNALAIDLGLPADWSVAAAIAAARDGAVVRRSPVEVRRHGGGATVRGFLFGAGAFVSATALAQRTHRAGAFNGVAVALALGWAIAQTVFGPADSDWRRGSRIDVRFDGDAAALGGAVPTAEAARYLMLASTLHRMPAGLKPFGTPRPGLKTLLVDTPPRRLAINLPALLSGSEVARLAADGYHRVDVSALSVVLEHGFIFDGEVFPPGEYQIERGSPLSFVVP